MLMSEKKIKKTTKIDTLIKIELKWENQLKYLIDSDVVCSTNLTN